MFSVPCWPLNRDFKIRWLRTTVGLKVFLLWSTGPSTQRVAQKYEVKIAGYRHRTMNKAHKLQKKLASVFIFCVQNVLWKGLKCPCLLFSGKNNQRRRIRTSVWYLQIVKTIISARDHKEYDDFCLDSFESTECLTEFKDSNNSTLLVSRCLLCCPADPAGQNLTNTVRNY